MLQPHYALNSNGHMKKTELTSSNNKKIRFISYGFSGTKFLTSLTSKYIDCAHDGNQGPHTPFHNIPDREPNNYLHELYKVVVLYSDPRNAFISLFSDEKRAKKHLQHLHYNEPLPSFRGIRDMDKYIKFGPFENFFNSWLYAKADFDICFLKYEKILEKRFELAEFLEIPVLYRKLFCSDISKSYGVRKSNYKNLPKEKQIKLGKIFSGLIETQNNLDDYFIKYKND